jgi:hypothetical protein
MFVYHVDCVSVTTTPYQTSATPNTEIDAAFVKPGARTLGILELIVGGRGAGLTAISGIAYRLKKWPTTASSGGTAIVPTPRDPGAQASKASAGAGAGGGTGAVTSGTGTAVFVGGCLSGAAGPGGWTAANDDAMPKLEASATQSIDLFSASAQASLNYEFKLGIVE